MYEQLTRVLDAHDQKVVIALDNIDFYYGTQLRTPEQKRIAARSLEDLASLASPHTQRTLTLLSGSSGLLHRLLQQQDLLFLGAHLTTACLQLLL